MTDLIRYQVPPDSPVSDALSRGTNLIIPPLSIAERLRHLPESVYELVPETYLWRLVEALLDPVSTEHSRQIAAVLSSGASNVLFGDLDSVYGAIFGIRRRTTEINTVTSRSMAEPEQWLDAYARDASYRQRSQRFAQAANLGPTSVGMEAIAEAVVGGDIDIAESTHHFDIYCSRPLSDLARYEMETALHRLKPAHVTFSIIAPQTSRYTEVTLSEPEASSNHWQIVSLTGSTADLIPPHTHPRFVSWTHMASAQASGTVDGIEAWLSDETGDFTPQSALGVGALPDILTHPYRSDTYVQGETVTDAVARGVAIPPPRSRWWATLPKSAESPATEVLNVNLAEPSPINRLTFRTFRVPHRGFVEYFDAPTRQWVQVHQFTVSDSSPGRYGASFIRPDWVPIQVNFPQPITSQSLRIRLQRYNLGVPPVNLQGVPVPYSLGLSQVLVGYSITSRDTVPVELDGAVAAFTAPDGSRRRYALIESSPEAVLTPSTDDVWRSELQPVPEAAVWLTVKAEGKVSHFEIAAASEGAILHLYHSIDNENWEPIPRTFRLASGIISVPPRPAGWWKFEMTYLSPLVTDAPRNPVPVSYLTIPSQQAEHGRPDSTVPGVETEIRLPQRLPRSTSVRPAGQLPTEVLHTQDRDLSQSLRRASIYGGFLAWQRPADGPYFAQEGPHEYVTQTTSLTEGVGFGVAIRSITALLDSKTSILSSPDVIDETFDDDNSITTSTWVPRDGYISSEGRQTATAIGQVAVRSPIEAVQFATQQTEPQDIAQPITIETLELNSDEDWHVVGDAFVAEAPVGVIVARQSAPIDPVDSDPDINLDLPHPVFSTFAGQITPGATGGVQSGPLLVSEFGEVEAAVTITAITSLDFIELQIVDPDDTVVARRVVDDLRPDESRRVTLKYIIGSFVLNRLPTFEHRTIVDQPDQTLFEDDGLENLTPSITDVGQSIYRMRIIQTTPRTAAWRVSDVSFKNNAVVWAFSHNGTDWVGAAGVRNNAQGAVKLPASTTDLYWRVTAHAANQSVSHLRIRPRYTEPVRSTTADLRGPQASIFDASPPIEADPLFYR